MEWKIKIIVADIDWMISLEHNGDTEWSWKHWPKEKKNKGFEIIWQTKIQADFQT